MCHVLERLSGVLYTDHSKVRRLGVVPTSIYVTHLKCWILKDIVKRTSPLYLFLFFFLLLFFFRFSSFILKLSKY